MCASERGNHKKQAPHAIHMGDVITHQTYKPAQQAKAANGGETNKIWRPINHHFICYCYLESHHIALQELIKQALK